MIKTIVSSDIGELDKTVNDFMIVKGQNLPVRTESFVVNFKETAEIYHKATIFFNETFGTGPTEEIKISTATTQTFDTNKPEKLGALWMKDSKISGTFNGKRLNISEDVAKKLIPLGMIDNLILEIEGVSSKIIRNKFKKETKHPDFLIYENK